MKITKLALLGISFFFAISTFANQTVNNYNLVVYQGDCCTYAVVYRISSNTKAQIIAYAIVDAISEKSVFGKSGNLKFTDEAASLINCCLTRLSINFALATKSDKLINLDSIVMGIAGYDTFKDSLYDNKTTRLNYLADLLYMSLKHNRFIYNHEAIDMVSDIALINAVSCQLIKNDIINYKLANNNKSYGRVWTFWLGSIVVAMRSKKNLLTTDVKKYLTNNECSYYNLGKKAAEFFTYVEDKNDIGSNKVQQLINRSALSKQLLDKRGYSLSYWLQEDLQRDTKNNVRGLAVVEHVLDNIKVPPLKQNTNNTENLVTNNKPTVDSQTTTHTQILQQNLINNSLEDNSIITVVQYSLDLIAASINVISTQEQPNINENDIILISGELLRSKFIRENYIKCLDDSISDARIRDRIQLINPGNFVFGLALAAECIKEDFFYENDSSTEIIEPYSSKSSDESEDLAMCSDKSYSDSDVFLDDTDNTSDETPEIPTKDYK
jgi:hypothetical protein